MPPNDTATSYISRWVAGLILPLATAAATLVAVKANAWFGVQLDPAEIVAFVLSVAAGGVTWLWNRGRYEVAQATGLDEATIDAIAARIAAEKLPAPSNPGKPTG